MEKAAGGPARDRSLRPSDFRSGKSRDSRLPFLVRRLDGVHSALVGEPNRSMLPRWLAFPREGMPGEGTSEAARAARHVDLMHIVDGRRGGAPVARRGERQKGDKGRRGTRSPLFIY